MKSVQTQEAYIGGQILWDALPFEATEPLRALPKNSPRPWRLKISCDSLDVADFPWEWISDGTDPPFALRTNMRIVRSVPVRYPLPPLTIARALRVLLVLTNQKNEQFLDPHREIAAVKDRLILPDYQLHILDKPTLDALSNELATTPPDIVHYIGHAGLNYGEGNLILHGNTNRAFGFQRRNWHRLLPSSVRLLCLSTCFTATNYQLLGLPRLAYAPATLSLPTVVANQFPVQEESVRDFWYRFYDTLTNSGGNVNEAVHFARIWLQGHTTTSADWTSFILVLRDRTGQPFRFHRGMEAVNSEIINTELQAQFATELANKLAEQLRDLPTTEGEVPRGLREQLGREQARALDLHAKLADLDDPHRQSGG